MQKALQKKMLGINLEKDGIDFNNFDSEEEALNLAKKIYEKR